MNRQPRDLRGRYDANWRSAPGAPPPPSPPSPEDVLAEELDGIDARLDAVREAGREAFREGTASYDRASMAVIRLASLFEKEEARFGELLSEVTQLEREGIARTRNIASHAGYAGMDEDRFWHTVTVDVPGLVARIRQSGSPPSSAST